MFKDLFSKQAGTYARYRPTYPPELFEYLASLVTVHDRAWDCGTGNGQAACGLAPYFKEIIATDPSEEQLRHANRKKNVRYVVAPAEACPLEHFSVNLVTVAQAAHWFRLDEFYCEVRRVLTPGGIIALWTYKVAEVNPEIDSLTKRYAEETMKEYWDPLVQIADAGYTTIDFPFEEIIPPEFFMRMEWTREEFLGYFSSWSSTQKYSEVNAYSPVEDLRKELLPLWGDPSGRKEVRWKINFRIGRV